MAHFQKKNPKSKIQNPKFGGSCEGIHWYILWPFGLFYIYLIYCMVIWCIFTVLVCCAKENLATLAVTGDTKFVFATDLSFSRQKKTTKPELDIQIGFPSCERED
jgi:hypothetical protein